MIQDFKTFNEGRSNWWLKKPDKVKGRNLFRRYDKYDHFYIKVPNKTYEYTIYTDHLDCMTRFCNDTDILEYIIHPFEKDNIKNFCMNAYGYNEKEYKYNYTDNFSIGSFPPYYTSDLDAANRLINKIDIELKKQHGEKYGIFDIPGYQYFTYSNET